jgi:microtubule-associated protein-like 5
LEEYYGSFKSVCDNFSIDESEFSHIFSCDYNIYKLWDTDKNGLIDALEVFSGLILFTTATFDEKVKCKSPFIFCGISF